MPPDGAVVGCDRRLTREQARPLGVRGRAEAEQDPGVRTELIVQADERGDADTAADEQPAAGRINREPGSERSDQAQPLARPQLREPLGARAHGLEQELELALACARVREGPRQVGPLLRAPSPAVPGIGRS